MEKHHGILTNIHPAFKKFQIDYLIKAIEAKHLYETLKLKEKLVVWKFYFFAMIHYFTHTEAEETMQKFLFSSGTITQLCSEHNATKTALKTIKPYIQDPFNNIGNIYFILKEVTLEGVFVMMIFLEEGVQRQFFMSYLINVRNKKADVTGKDLIKLGYSPGPKFAEVLKEVLKAKLDGVVGDKKSQLDYAKKLLEKESVH